MKRSIVDVEDRSGKNGLEIKDLNGSERWRCARLEKKGPETECEKLDMVKWSPRIGSRTWDGGECGRIR